MAEAEAWVIIPKLDEKKTGCVLEMKPLVLCKDCTHKGQTIHQEDGTNIIVCWNQGYGIYHPIDWFCADGVRRCSEMIDKERLIKAWGIFQKSNPYEICEGREFRAIKEPEYCMGQMISDTIDLLKEKPEVVRCKDCQHWRHELFNIRGSYFPNECELFGYGWNENDYCSYAVRRR